MNTAKRWVERMAEPLAAVQRLQGQAHSQVAPAALLGGMVLNVYQVLTPRASEVERTAPRGGDAVGRSTAGPFLCSRKTYCLV
jgi:hypothetical protein